MLLAATTAFTLAFFLFIILKFFSWVNNKKINKHYDKVAALLENHSKINPGLFSYGIVKGTYKGREVEYKLGLEYSGWYKGSLKITARMKVNLKEKQATGFFLDKRLTDNVFMDNDYATYCQPQPFVFKEDKILSILEELSLAANKYEKWIEGTKVQCLKCGSTILPNQNKCSKCDWSWE